MLEAEKWRAFLGNVNDEIQVDSFAHYFKAFLSDCSADGKSNLIDLGAGNGRFSIAAAYLGFNVTAVDLSSDGLSSLMVKAKNLGVHSRIETVQASFDDIPLESGKFCGAFSIRALSHGNRGSIEAAFSELDRLCRPDSSLFLYCLSDEDFRCKMGGKSGDSSFTLGFGPEAGVEHFFPSDSDLKKLTSSFSWKMHKTDSYPVPRMTRYFSSFPDDAISMMRERNLCSSHHCIIASKEFEIDQYQDSFQPDSSGCPRRGQGHEIATQNSELT